MTAPTISRKLWFWPGVVSKFVVMSRTQPLDATVCFVFPPKEEGAPWKLNLHVRGHNGMGGYALEVPLYETISDAHGAGVFEDFATWMPYQRMMHEKNPQPEPEVAPLPPRSGTPSPAPAPGKVDPPDLPANAPTR